MSYKYQNLEELRRKKELLKNEVSELEGIIKFDNKKESLSVLTNGFTDDFLKETIDENGERKISVKSDVVAKRISTNVRERILSKNSMMSFADTAMRGGVVDDALKLGAVALVTNFAKKKMGSSSWKQKLIGVALIYVAPFVLRFIRKKLEDLQSNKSVSSLEKLI